MEEALADIESLDELGSDFAQVFRHIAVDIVEHIRILFDDFQHCFFVNERASKRIFPAHRSDRRT